MSAPGVPLTSRTSIVQSVDSVADLRSADMVGFVSGAKLWTPITLHVCGYYAGTKAGGGTFQWNPVSASADDGGTIIRPSTLPVGRFERVVRDPSVLDATWFGYVAYPTGTAYAEGTTITCGLPLMNAIWALPLAGTGQSLENPNAAGYDGQTYTANQLLLRRGKVVVPGGWAFIDRSIYFSTGVRLAAEHRSSANGGPLLRVVPSFGAAGDGAHGIFRRSIPKDLVGSVGAVKINWVASQLKILGSGDNDNYDVFWEDVSISGDGTASTFTGVGGLYLRAAAQKSYVRNCDLNYMEAGLVWDGVGAGQPNAIHDVFIVGDPTRPHRVPAATIVALNNHDVRMGIVNHNGRATADCDLVDVVRADGAHIQEPAPGVLICSGGAYAGSRILLGIECTRKPLQIGTNRGQSGDPGNVVGVIAEIFGSIGSEQGQMAVVTATRANPCVLTVDRANIIEDQQSVYISGAAVASGSNPYNGTFMATKITSVTYSIGIDTTGAGVYSGAGVLVAAPWNNPMVRVQGYVGDVDVTYDCGSGETQVVQPAYGNVGESYAVVNTSRVEGSVSIFRNERFPYGGWYRPGNNQGNFNARYSTRCASTHKIAWGGGISHVVGHLNASDALATAHAAVGGFDNPGVIRSLMASLFLGSAMIFDQAKTVDFDPIQVQANGTQYVAGLTIEIWASSRLSYGVSRGTWKVIIDQGRGGGTGNIKVTSVDSDSQGGNAPMMALTAIIQDAAGASTALPANFPSDAFLKLRLGVSGQAGDSFTFIPQQWMLWPRVT